MPHQVLFQLPLLKVLSPWSADDLNAKNKGIYFKPSCSLSIAFHISLCSKHFMPDFLCNPLQVLLLPLHYFVCLVNSSFIAEFLKSSSLQNFAHSPIFLYSLSIYFHAFPYFNQFSKVIASKAGVLTSMSVRVQAK